MTSRNLTILILLGALTGCYIFWNNVNLNLTGLNQGFAPEQPLAFSHRLHSGDLQMDCQYCHSGAAKGAVAGIPPAATCMNCHRFVTAAWDKVKIEEQQAQKAKRAVVPPVAPELQKLYSATGFDTQAMAYTGSTGKPIAWKRVHNLPDFVYFDHSRHVTAGVTCQTCHGPVETMDKVSQINDLSMAWCVTCHREVSSGKNKDLQGKNPSLNCSACHY